MSRTCLRLRIKMREQKESEMNDLIKSKTLPPNHVIYRIRDYSGELIEIQMQSYNGTLENMASRMSNLQSQWAFGEYSGVNSQSFATDENGILKWVISPNCKHIAEIETKEARYILGDMSAKT